MLSLNVPAPGSVERLAADLAPALVGFESIRDRHSVVVKRFGDAEVPGHVTDRARRAVAGVGPVDLRIAGVGAFEDPPLGPGPVCYLAVEGPGLFDVHRRLVEEFGAVEGLEGQDYVPHVTLARGGSAEALEGLVGRSVEPVAWTARELVLVDGAGGDRVGTVALE